VVNDFIDMRKERNRRNVEHTLRDAVKRDRARTKILRTSPFGLIEMTRQRIRPSIKRSVYKECPACNGSGLVKSAESMAIEVVRKLLMCAHTAGVARIKVTVEEEVASYLNNKKRRDLVQLEQDSNVEVQVVSGEGLSPEYLKVDCVDANGREVRIAGESNSR
jgi:ribonuclease E